MRKEKCTICDTFYNQCEVKSCDDSHFSYDEYFSCPNCGYNPGLRLEIEDMLKNIKIKQVQSKKDDDDEYVIKIKINTDDLIHRISAAIKNFWPQENKKVRKYTKQMYTKL